MAWWNDLLGFGKEAFDSVKKLWVEGSQKVSNMAFDADTFYDVTNNVAAKKGGENGFVMLKEARDTMRDELDTMSLKLYNNKYNVASQAELEKAYSNMYDEAFINRAYNQQIYAAGKGKGVFADNDKYSNFDFSDMGKNLTKEQQEILMKEFRTDYDSRLEDIYKTYVPDDMVLSNNAKLNSKGQSTNGQSWIERVEGDVVETGNVIDDISSNKPVGPSIDGPTVPLLDGPVEEAVKLHSKANDLNFNYGMQKKYISENVPVLDFATSAESDLRGINKAINNSTHTKELNAYRNYLNERLMTVPDKTGTWEAPDNIFDYFTKQGYDATTAKELKTEYNKLVSKNIASGNPDHSGIGLWQKAKKHPVIATSLVTGTAFGISELTEEDSF